jgi:hypothetical protein
MNSAQPLQPQPRHAELVSASIGPRGWSVIGMAESLTTLPHRASVKAAKWALKQVQGDGIVGEFA